MLHQTYYVREIKGRERWCLLWKHNGNRLQKYIENSGHQRKNMNRIMWKSIRNTFQANTQESNPHIDNDKMKSDEENKQTKKEK